MRPPSIVFHRHLVIVTIIFLMVSCPHRVRADDQAKDSVALDKQWGRETLETIRRDFYNASSGLYDDTLDAAGKKKGPTMMWGCGVQLSALNAAAKLDPFYLSSARSYADALDRYWIISKKLGGYNPAPGAINSSSDRYYDDNEWIVLDLADLYQLTGSAATLYKARETMKFVMSGEDEKLGGGIYWHEPKLESKNTCSNAPVITALLHLYMLTGEQSYLDDSFRLYTWTNAKLQDPSDGLFYDNIRIDGSVDKMKLTYNTALMIRANCLLYLATGNDLYLLRARHLGEASIEHWVDKITGVVKGAGKFSHLLLDAFGDLNNVDPANPLWLATIDRCVSYVHDHLKDANGHYAESWDHLQPAEPLKEWSLIDQASVARAYWTAAGAFRPPVRN
jgi:uncharacterized protein YyaL (SSP411 family)